MKRSLAPLLVDIAALTLPAYALDPIPAEGGFSGYLNAGAGYASVKSAFIAGNRAVDLDNATVDALDGEPGSAGLGLPVVGFDLTYTFGTSRSQVSLGNTLEDFLRFEAAAQLAYRKQFGDRDRIAAGFLFSAPVTEVYEDPYVAGVERDVTTRDTRGARVTWDRILGSRVELELSARRIKIGDERSGETQLALPASESELLDRNGWRKEVQVAYTFLPGGGGTQAIIPALTVGREDLDGKAVAADLLMLQVTYRWNGRTMAVSSNLRVGSRDADDRNPVFGETMQLDAVGVSVQFFYKKLGGVEGLSLLVAAADQTTDSNIDFYKSRTTLGSLGIFYRF